MGHDFRIGQRVVEREVCGDEVYEHVTAAWVDGASVGAPKTVSRNGDNTLSSPYGGFSQFLMMLGVEHGDVVGGYPGVVELTERHAQAWENAAERYEEIEIDPLWAGYISDDKQNRLRIAFFRFWIRWALDNCADPIIAHS